MLIFIGYYSSYRMINLLIYERYMLMKLKNSKLILLRQIDVKLAKFNNLLLVPMPHKGWIYQLRKTINMSQIQLASRLQMSAQGVSDLEKREAEGAITIKSLRQAGEALDMNLVYGFVPKGGSLEEMIEQRAYELARRIVKHSSVSMVLEDQENSKERILESVKEMIQDLKKEMPKSLWD